MLTCVNIAEWEVFLHMISQQAMSAFGTRRTSGVKAVSPLLTLSRLQAVEGVATASRPHFGTLRLQSFVSEADVCAIEAPSCQSALKTDCPRALDIDLCDARRQTAHRLSVQVFSSPVAVGVRAPCAPRQGPLPSPDRRASPHHRPTSYRSALPATQQRVPRATAALPARLPRSGRARRHGSGW